MRPSFSGFQDKFVAKLIQTEGKYELWPVDQRSERGNVIVKPAHPKYRGVAENEYTCMHLAKKAGLNAAPTYLFKQPSYEYGGFTPQHLLVGRFDFEVVNGIPEKLDVAEAAAFMGLTSDQKYDATTPQLFDTMETYLTQGFVDFVRSYFFGIAVGNGDMHTKNFSLITTRDKQIILSPTYDMICTSALAYSDLLALPMSGERGMKDKASTRIQTINDVLIFMHRWISISEMSSMLSCARNNLEDCLELAFAESEIQPAKVMLKSKITEALDRTEAAMHGLLTRLTNDDLESQLSIS